IGLVGVVKRGRGLLDIDFTGGVSVEALFEQPQDIADIRDRVKDLPDVTVQDIHIEGEPAGKRFLVITSKSDIDESQPVAAGPKTNILWVEEQLKSAFDDPEHRLAFNHLSWGEITAAAQSSEKGDVKPPAKAAASSKPAADESKAAEEFAPPDEASEKDEQTEPSKKSDDVNASDAEKQSQFLPGDENLLALAEDDEAEPGAKSDASPADDAESQKESAPADVPQRGDDDKEAPRQTPTGDPLADGSTTTLSFSEKADHETLSRRITEALKATGHADEDVLFSLDNRDYEVGSNRGFKEWTLKIALPAQATKAVLAHVQQQLAEKPYFPSSNKVGASVAGNTQLQATYALLASLALIVVYVWIRFQQVSFGFAAVLALVHDVLVALGGLALSFWLAQMPFMDKLLIEPFKINLPIIAAFLTIIGYSINDTIVIFDRIREVRGKSPDMSPDLVNLCINQTLSRTLLTSLTVFIVVLILYIVGGQGIHGFAFTLVVGTISGTYSTVYIATPVLIWMNRRKTSSPPPSKTQVASVGRGAA
ncbi:MAG: protein translocase subunit SecF, partial [Pirellulales bacterium]